MDLDNTQKVVAIIGGTLGILWTLYQFWKEWPDISKRLAPRKRSEGNNTYGITPASDTNVPSFNKLATIFFWIGGGALIVGMLVAALVLVGLPRKFGEAGGVLAFLGMMAGVTGLLVDDDWGNRRKKSVSRYLLDRIGSLIGWGIMMMFLVLILYMRTNPPN